MEYTIIEDCSPFFIRFRWNGIEELISLCQQYPYPEPNNLGFRHVFSDYKIRKEILKLTPMNRQMILNPYRVSFFVTEPGMYYGAHKDGPNCRFSINVTIKILDNNCITSWYSDNDLAEYSTATGTLPSLGVADAPSSQSREVLNWDRKKHIPVKTMIAQPNEAILFNTDIYHDWDNSNSTNRRIVLTLRHLEQDRVYFQDAKKILFARQ